MDQPDEFPAELTKSPLAASEQRSGRLGYQCCLLAAFAAEDLLQERISAVWTVGGGTAWRVWLLIATEI